jgi:hypothetical protein
MTDIKIDRSKLQAEYIDRILESMDMSTLMMIAQENLEAEFNQMGDADFVNEVTFHYPDLLED